MNNDIRKVSILNDCNVIHHSTKLESIEIEIFIRIENGFQKNWSTMKIAKTFLALSELPIISFSTLRISSDMNSAL